MLRSTMTTPAAGTDHGHRPTYGHNATYADVETQVPSCASPGHTEIWLIVDGLLAGRRFGDVRVQPCGAVATNSGGQHEHGDVAQPLSDREVWLDFDTDADGHGVGRTRTPWRIEAGSAGAVVVHASPTDPVTGAAGSAAVLHDRALRLVISGVRWWNGGTPMSITSSSEPQCKGGSWWPPTFRSCHPVLARQGSRCLLRRDEVT